MDIFRKLNRIRNSQHEHWDSRSRAIRSPVPSRDGIMEVWDALSKISRDIPWYHRYNRYDIGYHRRQQATMFFGELGIRGSFHWCWRSWAWCSWRRVPNEDGSDITVTSTSPRMVLNRANIPKDGLLQWEIVICGHVSSVFQKWYVGSGEGRGLLSATVETTWSDAEIPGENVTTLFQFGSQ